ncbi:MAG: cellulase family glycosylhydrolase [Candidatus Marinimicrobia bacterium]|nr:cellulase family glycosylhydrolase [Candidatus Neomarinimicrobiota bacterium]
MSVFAMKTFLRNIYFIIPVLLLNCNTLQAGFFKTLGFDIIDGNGNKIILKGYGLGGWLVPEGYMLHAPGYGSPSSIHNNIEDLIGKDATEAFFKEYRQNYVAEEDIALIAEWGFNSIRLPFHYEFFSPIDSPGVFIEDGFEIIDTLLIWCKKYGLYLILDMHCAPGGQNAGNISDSDGEARLWTESVNQDRTVEIWKRIATRYAEEEWIIGYDLLNEPVLPEGYGNSVLRDFFIRLTTAIREVDKNHTVYIEGNWYATDFSGLGPRFDSNLVWAFHKYWNETDLSSIQQYRNLRTQTITPLWLGETGENSNPWFYETVQLMDQYNIGWNWWAHKKFETNTSPLSANINPGYQQIINYWNNQGNRPTPETAQAALMEMAANLKLERCVFNPDVIAALTDPEFGTVSKPYSVHIIPGSIAAADYDLGTCGVAYYDTEFKKIRWDIDQPWNQGYSYRNDGVDIQKSENSIAYNIGWINADEWVNYTVEINYPGNYNVSFRIASPSSNGRLQMYLDGGILINSLAIPSTGDWQNWQDIQVENVSLPQGNHTIKILFTAGEFNFQKMTFSTIDNALVEELAPTLYLGNNYPNPFNHHTLIPIILTTSRQISVIILDINGNLINTLTSGTMNAGRHLLEWNGSNASKRQVSTGVYFYKLTIDKEAEIIRPMLFLK